MSASPTSPSAMLDEAMKLATEPLVTNQIEVHPFLDQSEGARGLQASTASR